MSGGEPIGLCGFVPSVVLFQGLSHFPIGREERNWMAAAWVPTFSFLPPFLFFFSFFFPPGSPAFRDRPPRL